MTLAELTEEIIDMVGIGESQSDIMHFMTENGYSESREPVNIVFDGPPGPESGRFIEVENDAGKSIKAGEWTEREDGYWSLRIT